MKEYTFNVLAAVTIHADSEEEARKELLTCCLDEDVEIGPGGVYLPTYRLEEATLEDVYDREGEDDEPEERPTPDDEGASYL